jgi:hypothetical protein
MLSPTNRKTADTYGGAAPQKYPASVDFWNTTRHRLGDERFLRGNFLILASREGLDVRILRHFGIRDTQILAIDRCPAALGEFQKRFPGVRTQCTDVETFSFTTRERFDAIFLDLCGPLNKANSACIYRVGRNCIRRHIEGGILGFGLMRGREKEFAKLADCHPITLIHREWTPALPTPGKNVIRASALFRDIQARAKLNDIFPMYLQEILYQGQVPMMYGILRLYTPTDGLNTEHNFFERMLEVFPLEDWPTVSIDYNEGEWRQDPARATLRMALAFGSYEFAEGVLGIPRSRFRALKAVATRSGLAKEIKDGRDEQRRRTDALDQKLARYGHLPTFRLKLEALMKDEKTQAGL